MSPEMQPATQRARPIRGLLQLALCYAAFAGLMSLVASTALQAQTCPAERPLHLPELKEPKDNIDKHKQQLKDYAKNDYQTDIKLVLDDASGYVVKQADAMSQADRTEHPPAVVLDIDETSLSNWDNILADDFGFISGGECSMAPKLACGFPAWIDRAEAIAIEPTRKFFNAVRAKDIAVFFITGRRDSQRRVTILNLHHEGFFDWTGLITRPDDDPNKDTIVPFKSGARAEIESGKYNKTKYHIIATIGDQYSDLIGNGNPDSKDTSAHAECGFKIPNPFYFIK
jgi:predicted secreted acid phosphatase